MYSADSLDFTSNFSPRDGDNYDSLEWPFKAIFTTKLTCHKYTKESLIVKSPVIVIQRKEFATTIPFFVKQIGSIPLSTDLTGFIKSDELDLQMTIQILKNNSIYIESYL